MLSKQKIFFKKTSIKTYSTGSLFSNGFYNLQRSFAKTLAAILTEVSKIHASTTLSGSKVLTNCFQETMKEWELAGENSL